jgi:hypothetical protein
MRRFGLKWVLGFAVSAFFAVPVHAQGIDVVFKIDESGSMGPDIADVQANVVTIFSNLPAGSSVGLVGFGTGSHFGGLGQIPHIHTALTSDSAVFQNAVNQLIASGGLEQGYRAVYESATDTIAVDYPGGNSNPSLGFTGAPYCNILIADETPNQGGRTRQEAIDAMNAVNGVFFGILPNSLHGEAQPLADATGGQLFDLLAFRQNATPVIEAVLAACVEAVQPVIVDIKPASCPNPYEYGQRGALPVAIVGTDSFDVTSVVVDSIRLNGDCPVVRSAYEDAAQPYEDGFSDPLSELDCIEYSQTTTLPDGSVIEYVDGITDLTLKFDPACVAGTVADPEGTPYLQLWPVTGKYLNANGDEVEFSAEDVVRVQ